MWSCTCRFMDTLGELSELSGSSDAETEVPLPKAKKKKALAEPAPEELEQLGYSSCPQMLPAWTHVRGYADCIPTQVQKWPVYPFCARAKARARLLQLGVVRSPLPGRLLPADLVTKRADTARLTLRCPATGARAQLQTVQSWKRRAERSGSARARQQALAWTKPLA